MTTRTPAEIEAGAKEYVWPSRAFSAEEQDALWLKISESDRRHYLDRFRDVLSAADAAADAAAAPAVGVTVEWLDARIAESEPELEQQSLTIQARNRARAEAFREVRALLTAQPEPGTHDDAGQPAEGGVK